MARILGGVIDNSISLCGTRVEGLKVFSPREKNLREKDIRIFVSSRLYYKEIMDQLVKIGVKQKNIINVGLMLDNMSERQYFDLDAMPHVERECFADIGSFDGKTSLGFMKWSKEWEHIYCFEVDKKNICRIENNLDGVDKISIIKKAAWSSEGVINFNAKGNGSSAVDIVGDKVLSTTIDSELQDKRITFIKMDIEGAENEALIGAKNVISRQKPKLAISIYHREEDILSILQRIMEYNPEYRFYLRHYSLTDSETVLYAV